MTRTSASEDAQPPLRDRPATYAETIRRGAETDPDAIALICGDDRLTWRQVFDRSCRAAQGMLETGVRRQERVAYIGKNSMEFFEVLYRASMIGAVPAGINWRLAASEMLAVINDTQASLLFIGSQFVPHLTEMADGLTYVRNVVVVNSDGSAYENDYETYDSWLSRHRAEDPDIPVAQEDIAMQTYTSGTTGRPKGVMHSVGAIAASFSIAEVLGISDRTVALIATPVFHATAAAAAAMVLGAGGRCVIAREADPDTLLGLIEQHGVTMSILVPTIIKTIIESPAVAQHDLSSFETLGYTAAPISPDLLARAQQRFEQLRFLQVYGSTETLGVTVLRPEEHASHPLSAGRPLPNVTVRLVDPLTGDDVRGADATGEVWVKAPTAMAGYWNLPDETSRTLTTDGFVRTGDIGRLEGEYLVLLDRLKDMIISGGENIYPVEVENVLSAHPLVNEVAVVGVPSDKWGETVMAFAVRNPDEGSCLSEEELIEFARARLARYKCPTAVRFIDVLPRNPSGKVLKTVLREPFWKSARRQIG